MIKKRKLPELGTDKVLAQILQDPKRREAFLAEPMAEPLRPCEVDGKPAFFHRWCDEDRALLQFKALVRREDAEELRTLFDDRGICPPSAHIETVRYTFALVEFQDGSVKKVDPERVRFMDKEAGR
jgi:hypothetical protein